MKTLREIVRVGVIGLLMGAAEIVPGVSGGTIAFISGIYERLINAIRQFTPYVLVELRNVGIKAVWRKTDASFLLVLFSGMLISILIFASGVGYLLQHEAIALWSFFSGLVLASSLIVSRQISSFGFDIALATAIGLVIGIVITQLVPVNLSPTPLMLFVGGSVAICAWILPGLSGSFVLLILGLYAFVINAIKTFALADLAFLAAGCAVGIVCFSQVLARLFRHYRNETLAMLTGFMLGSLAKLWPWKNTISYQLGEDGSQIPLVQEPILPDAYHQLTGQEPDILLALACALGGAILVLAMDWYTRPGHAAVR